MKIKLIIALIFIIAIVLIAIFHKNIANFFEWLIITTLNFAGIK